MNKIYEKGQFIILEGDSQYILMNKHKGFDVGHTHLKNYKTALWLIKLAEHRSIPHHISLYRKLWGVIGDRRLWGVIGDRIQRGVIGVQLNSSGCSMGS